MDIGLLSAFSLNPDQMAAVALAAALVVIISILGFILFDTHAGIRQNRKSFWWHLDRIPMNGSALFSDKDIVRYFDSNKGELSQLKGRIYPTQGDIVRWLSEVIGRSENQQLTETRRIDTVIKDTTGRRIHIQANLSQSPIFIKASTN